MRHFDPTSRFCRAAVAPGPHRRRHRLISSIAFVLFVATLVFLLIAPRDGDSAVSDTKVGSAPRARTLSGLRGRSGHAPPAIGAWMTSPTRSPSSDPPPRPRSRCTSQVTDSTNVFRGLMFAAMVIGALVGVVNYVGFLTKRRVAVRR